MKKLNFKKLNGLIPAVIQDASTKQVLMVGFMNQEALNKTLKTKKVWFYSRTKKRLWMKGEESKNILLVVSTTVDCDSDTILIQAKPAGPTCHTGEFSCFSGGKQTELPLPELYNIINSRKKTSPKTSYTASLFKAGVKKINKKIIEEATEVVMAGANESDQRLTEEASDVLYHLFVLLAKRGVGLNAIYKELNKRHKKPVGRD